MEAILAHWVPAEAGNTPKELLLLQEIEQVLKFAEGEHAEPALDIVMPKFLHCLSPENSQVVQSVLLMWKQPHFCDLVNTNLSKNLPLLLAAIYRGGQPHWNVTVNKMAGMVLQKLRAANEGAFMSAALRLPDPVSRETLSTKPADAPRLGVSP